MHRYRRSSVAPTDLPEVFLGQKRACLGAGGIPQDVVSQNLCEVILHLTSCTVRHHHQTDPTECEREDHGHQLLHDSNYHTHSAKAFVTGEVSCVEREGGGGACGKSHTTLAVSVPLTCMVCVLTTSTSALLKALLLCCWSKQAQSVQHSGHDSCCVSSSPSRFGRVRVTCPVSSTVEEGGDDTVEWREGRKGHTLLHFVLCILLKATDVTHQTDPSLGQHQAPSWREREKPHLAHTHYSHTVCYLPSMKHPETSFLALPQRSPALECRTERRAKELP